MKAMDLTKIRILQEEKEEIMEEGEFPLIKLTLIQLLWQSHNPKKQQQLQQKRRVEIDGRKDVVIII